MSSAALLVLIFVTFLQPAVIAQPASSSSSGISGGKSSGSSGKSGSSSGKSGSSSGLTGTTGAGTGAGSGSGRLKPPGIAGIVVASIAGAIFLAIAICVCFKWKRRQRQQQKREQRLYGERPTPQKSWLPRLFRRSRNSEEGSIPDVEKNSSSSSSSPVRSAA